MPTAKSANKSFFVLRFFPSSLLPLHLLLIIHFAYCLLVFVLLPTLFFYLKWYLKLKSHFFGFFFHKILIFFFLQKNGIFRLYLKVFTYPPPYLYYIKQIHSAFFSLFFTLLYFLFPRCISIHFMSLHTIYSALYYILLLPYIHYKRNTVFSWLLSLSLPVFIQAIIQKSMFRNIQNTIYIIQNCFIIIILHTSQLFDIQT